MVYNFETVTDVTLDLRIFVNKLNKDCEKLKANFTKNSKMTTMGKIKCAEIYREDIIDKSSNSCTTCYTFWCFDCGEIFHYSSEIIEHIERTHNSSVIKKSNTVVEEIACFDDILFSNDTSTAAVTFVDVKEEISDKLAGRLGNDFAEVILKNEPNQADLVDNNTGNKKNSTVVRPDKNIIDTEHNYNSNSSSVETRETKRIPILKKPYKCEKCDVSFSYNYELQRHNSRHENLRLIACKDVECPLRFNVHSDMVTHYKKRHEKCTIEKLSIAETIKLAGRVSNDTDYSTEVFLKIELNPVDNFEANKRSSFARPDKKIINKEHIYNSDSSSVKTNDTNGIPISKKPYKCEKCDVSFSYNYELQRHNSRHENLRLFACKDDECVLRFNVHSDMVAHYKKIHAKWVMEKTFEEPITCSICNKEFFSTIGFNKHFQKVHVMDAIKFNCHICKKDFVTAQSLKRHMPSHTITSQFECDICLKKFNTKFHISRHMMVHGKEKRFKCDLCPRAFHLKTNYLNHHRMHTGEKIFQCTLCPKSFTCKNSLRSHTLRHNGQKPHQCEICGASFYLRTLLKYHMRRHTGIKSFKCSHCDMHFYEAHHRGIHEKTHSNEKLFACTVCNNSFKSSKTLRNHLRLHMDTKKHKCKYCDMTFAQSAGRRGHERNRHENNGSV